jgi:hypothetical protein
LASASAFCGFALVGFRGQPDAATEGQTSRDNGNQRFHFAPSAQDLTSTSPNSSRRLTSLQALAAGVNKVRQPLADARQLPMRIAPDRGSDLLALPVGVPAKPGTTDVKCASVSASKTAAVQLRR